MYIPSHAHPLTYLTPLYNILLHYIHNNIFTVYTPTHTHTHSYTYPMLYTYPRSPPYSTSTSASKADLYMML